MKMKKNVLGSCGSYLVECMKVFVLEVSVFDPTKLSSRETEQGPTSIKQKQQKCDSATNMQDII